jgi:hypothetical protein
MLSSSSLSASVTSLSLASTSISGGSGGGPSSGNTVRDLDGRVAASRESNCRGEETGGRVEVRRGDSGGDEKEWAEADQTHRRIRTGKPESYQGGWFLHGANAGPLITCPMTSVTRASIILPSRACQSAPEVLRDDGGIPSPTAILGGGGRTVVASAGPLRAGKRERKDPSP